MSILDSDSTTDVPVSLVKKGDNISLLKKAPSLKKVRVVVGWSEDRCLDGVEPDLDVSIFMLTSKGKVRASMDLIFYNTPNKKSICGSVVHGGDVKGGGSEEFMVADLQTLPSAIVTLAIVVTIDKADMLNLNFGVVSPAYINLIDDDTDQVISTSNLSTDSAGATSLLFGEVHRRNGNWQYSHIERPCDGGLLEFCNEYGVKSKDE